MCAHEEEGATLSIFVDLFVRTSPHHKVLLCNTDVMVFGVCPGSVTFSSFCRSVVSSPL